MIARKKLAILSSTNISVVGLRDRSFRESTFSAANMGIVVYTCRAPLFLLHKLKRLESNMAVKDLCPSTKAVHAVSSRLSYLGVDGYGGNLFGMNDFFSKNAKAWARSGQSYIQRSLFHSVSTTSWKDFKPALHCFCS